MSEKRAVTIGVDVANREALVGMDDPRTREITWVKIPYHDIDTLIGHLQNAKEQIDDQNPLN